MRTAILFVICALLALPASAQDRRGVSLYTSLPSKCLHGEGVIIPSGGSKGIYQCSADDTWTLLTDMAAGSGESVPQGAIIFIDSGPCPTGYAEATELEGKTIIGTVAANKDVGTTGGSDTITPEGEVTAPTFTGTPFTDVINHTHPVTDPGHTHVEQNNSATTGGLAGWGARDTSTNTAVATGYSTQSATTGVTTNNPAGGVASITPAGTNSAPSFTGTEHDNRSAFIKVIGCRKS